MDRVMFEFDSSRLVSGLGWHVGMFFKVQTSKPFSSMIVRWRILSGRRSYGALRWGSVSKAPVCHGPTDGAPLVVQTSTWQPLCDS